jgi:three-Cys-motif partner protein
MLRQIQLDALCRVLDGDIGNSRDETMSRAPVGTDREHAFGGAWTELKLDAVHYYLKFYTLVLKDKPSPTNPFELWYIDAFAGSGSRQEVRATGGLFDGLLPGQETVDLAGSVLRALEVDPPFKRLVFIEGHRGRFRSLEAIAATHPERNIQPLRGDANARLRHIFDMPPWSTQNEGRGSHRAVVFLDPYGMSVEWETLKLLADTKAVDVWYLFPTGAVNRQLAGKLARVDEHKQKKLDAIFGTAEWRDIMYRQEQEFGLFGGMEFVGNKQATIHHIEQYAQKRLKTIFRYVSKPLPLFKDRDAKIFSLFCLANPASERALGLITKGVNAVLKKYA